MRIIRTENTPTGFGYWNLHCVSILKDEYSIVIEFCHMWIVKYGCSNGSRSLK